MSNPPSNTSTPALRHVLSIEFQTARQASSGHPEGDRYLLTVTGGRLVGNGPQGAFEGVVTHGSDWVTQRRDGSLSLDARAQLEATDGTVILMSYSGTSSHGVVHTTPRFSAPTDSAFDWLNTLACVAVGTVRNGGVSYEVYAV
jgi:hypothetical protein